MRQSRTLRAAYAECRRVALGHYENFPVGSILIPRKIRPHFFALYAFMRTADDFADEPNRPTQERLRLLADWRAQLDGALGDALPQSSIFLALQDTIRERKLPSAPLHRLLDAFEFDARGNVRFESFDDLHWYTTRSAEPVGELVLALFGYRDDERIQRSNAICTALQLINFLQDVAEDLQNGRCYIPRDDLNRFEIATPDELRESNRFGEVVLYECDRIEKLLASGEDLPGMVTGRLRLELRAVLLGARAMLRKIWALKGDTLRQRPKLSARERRAILIGAVFGAR